MARPLPETESRYYEYLFRTDAYMSEVNKFSRGIVSDRNRLYWEDFKQMPSPFPPSAEQEIIARFLSNFDVRVRRYIRAKRRIIDLLNEQKQEIVYRTITRGFDPNVRLKPSGIGWLGRVPEHWSIEQLRRRWEVVDCKHVTVPFLTEGIPLASVREVQSFDLDLSKANKTSEEWYEHPFFPHNCIPYSPNIAGWGSSAVERDG